MFSLTLVLCAEAAGEAHSHTYVMFYIAFCWGIFHEKDYTVSDCSYARMSHCVPVRFTAYHLLLLQHVVLNCIQCGPTSCITTPVQLRAALPRVMMRDAGSWLATHT